MAGEGAIFYSLVQQIISDNEIVLNNRFIKMSEERFLGLIFMPQ